jgi:hypothetical protein
MQGRARATPRRSSSNIADRKLELVADLQPDLVEALIGSAVCHTCASRRMIENQHSAPARGKPVSQISTYVKEGATAECVEFVTVVQQMAVVDGHAEKKLAKDSIREVGGPQHICVSEIGPPRGVDNATHLKPRGEKVGKGTEGEKPRKYQITADADGASFVAIRSGLNLKTRSHFERVRVVKESSVRVDAVGRDGRGRGLCVSSRARKKLCAGANNQTNNNAKRYWFT